MKKALITGITGQTGSYLAELLLNKGYEVHGIIRRSSSFNTGRIDHIFDKIHLHYGDITDALNIQNIVGKVCPHEIYNLAAQSHVKVSFELPSYTAMTDGIGTLNVLEAVKNIDPTIKVYQASTSELYGKVQEIPQKETTPFYPRSPYGVAKTFAHYSCVNYREAYGMHVSCGILFNHEGEYRGHEFVTRKITDGVAKIHLGITDKLYLGNLDAKRDWGYAPDYVEAMWVMLQQDIPDDYVILLQKFYIIYKIVDVIINGESYIKYYSLTLTQYKKVLLISPNFVILQNPDFLFTLNTPAAYFTSSRYISTDILVLQPDLEMFNSIVFDLMHSNFTLDESEYIYNKYLISN
mgnify:CR=1 FL=1